MSEEQRGETRDMRAVIQRVSEASVAIDGTTVGAIQKGF